MNLSLFLKRKSTFPPSIFLYRQKSARRILNLKAKISKGRGAKGDNCSRTQFYGPFLWVL